MMPVEVIERILLETVVAQTLRSSTTTCAIKTCSRHDDNLIAVCPLWKEIITGQRFREILVQRIAITDPKALYKTKCDSVKIIGVKVEKNFVLTSVTTLNDVMYTIEHQLQYQWQNENITRRYSIFAYDMQLSLRLQDKNQEGQLEVICTNKRQLPAAFDDHEIVIILPSEQHSCLYVASKTADDSKISKLTPDGAVLASWYVRDEGLLLCVAVDSSGQYLAAATYDCVRIFNSVGSLLASITLEDHPDLPIPSGVAILPDATVIISYEKFVPLAEGNHPVDLYSGRVQFIRAQLTSDGLLQYEDLSSTTPPEGHYTHRGFMFADSCGCVAVVQENHLVLIDSDGKTTRSGTHWKKKGDGYISSPGRECSLYLDERSGIMFFATYGKIYASQVRQIV